MGLADLLVRSLAEGYLHEMSVPWEVLGRTSFAASCVAREPSIHCGGE